jgi:uncharacterized membrane protein
MLRRLIFSVSVIAAAMAGAVVAAPVMTLLPTPANYSEAVAYTVTADGRCAAGQAFDLSSTRLRTAAIRWCDGVATVLPDVAGFSGFQQGFAITDDGKTIVGATGQGGPSAQPRVAFIWTEGVGTQELPGLQGGGGPSRSTALAITPDGRYVAGLSRPFGTGPNQFEAVRWQAGVPLQLDPGGALDRENVALMGISADGKVIVGSGNLPGDDPQRGFVWREATGFTVLGLPVGSGFTDSEARAVSADGTRIAGRFVSFSNAQNNSAVIWDGNGTVLSTLSLSGMYDPSITSLNANGTFGVGSISRDLFCNPGVPCITESLAVIYEEATGLRLFDDWFAGIGGVLPTGFGTVSLTQVTADGRYIVGQAYDGVDGTLGYGTPFILDLQGASVTIPEPAAAILLLTGLMMVSRARRTQVRRKNG